MRVRSFGFASLVSAFILAVSLGAFAAPPSLDNLPPNAAPVTDAAGDPPARVGRISLLSGTVSFHTADQDAWAAAVANYPIVSGDALWTEPGARAEIQAGDDALRLDGSTEVEIDRLDDQNFRVQVPQGSVNIHVGVLAPGETYQVVTPQNSVTVMQAGTYRISAGANGEADEVAVLKGRAQVNSENGTLLVKAGETAMVTPNRTPPMVLRATEPTAFDNWSLTRDNYEEPRQVVRYVSPDMTGYEDLDNYGNWQTEPEYGTVWIPSAVPAGWAPYHDGHWVWVSPWGWTWVDDAPWGFAPFHYGRWANIHNRWCWLPGERAPHPVYAPALVAFVGGNGWSVSIGVGERPVGWFPLGPNEIYRPGYRVSHNYIRNVNVHNVHDRTRITNVINNYNTLPPAGATPHGAFANQRFATVVDAKNFSDRHVGHDAIKVAPEKLSVAPVNAASTPPEAIAPHERAAPRPDRQEDRRDEQRNGGSPQARPATIAAPTAPAAPVTPNVAPRRENVPQPRSEESAPTPQNAAPQNASPGPAIRHHDMPARETRQERTQDRVVQTPAAQAPALVREIQTPRPVQTTPLRPTHEGWTRQERASPTPQQQAPQRVAPQQQQEHAAPAQRQEVPRQDHSGPERERPDRGQPVNR